MAIVNNFKKIEGNQYPFVEYRDLDFQNTGVLVTGAYSDATDRIYDVRTGASTGLVVQMINNTGATDILVEYTTDALEAAALYSSANVWQQLFAEQTIGVSGALSVVSEQIRGTPKVAAIRVRLKSTITNEVIKGYVGWF